MSSWLIRAVVGLAAALMTLIWFAPASLVDVALAKATTGRLRLADASGTFWEGRGRLLIPDLATVAENEQSGQARTLLLGFVVPGELKWSIKRLPVLVGLIDARLQLEGMPMPMQVSGGLNEIRLAPGSLSLAKVDLSGMGSPWNTIQPSALIGLRWGDIKLSKGLFEGRMTLELNDASSVLTPVQPLGSYQIDISSNGPAADVALKTLRGPLNLNGKGSWTNRTGLRFQAEAQPDASERERLSAFLALIGRRDGDRVLIRIGA